MKHRKNEHKSNLNFVIRSREESSGVDVVEMAQIRSNENLVKKIAKGHKDADKMRGKFTRGT